MCACVCLSWVVVREDHNTRVLHTADMQTGHTAETQPTVATPKTPWQPSLATAQLALASPLIRDTLIPLHRGLNVNLSVRECAGYGNSLCCSMREAQLSGQLESREWLSSGKIQACFHPHIPPLAFYNAPARVGLVVLSGGTVF